jgi:trehalose 6-phosphate phosphatase
MPAADTAAALLAPLASAPDRSALCLDLDGTLAPMVERPADARMIEGARPVLESLRDRFALLAFVSGRAIVDLERIVGIPGCAYAGTHGMELRRVGGELELADANDASETAIGELDDRFPSEVLDALGIWVERKQSLSLSFHFRSASNVERARRFLDDVVRPQAESLGLRAGWGRRILEVMSATAVTKGTSMRALLSEGALRNAAMIGDDRTDTDAWTALRQLKRAGRLAHVACILAGDPEVDPSVRDAADAEVDGPAGVLELLRTLL